MKIYLTKDWVDYKSVVIVDGQTVELTYYNWLILTILALARKKCLGLVVPHKYLCGKHTVRYIYRLKSIIKKKTWIDLSPYIKNEKGVGYWLDCDVEFDSILWKLYDGSSDNRICEFVEYLKKI